MARKKRGYETRTVIVGVGFHPGAQEAMAKVKLGEELVLLREPSNKFDKNAVAIMTSDGQKLGYVPRSDVPIVAAAIDEGSTLKCVAVRKGGPSISIKWE